MLNILAEDMVPNPAVDEMTKISIAAVGGFGSTTISAICEMIIQYKEKSQLRY